MNANLLKTGQFVITEDDCIGVVVNDRIIFKDGTKEYIKDLIRYNNIIFVLEGDIGFNTIINNYYKVLTGEKIQNIKIIYDANSAPF